MLIKNSLDYFPYGSAGGAGGLGRSGGPGGRFICRNGLMTLKDELLKFKHIDHIQLSGCGPYKKETFPVDWLFLLLFLKSLIFQ